MRAHKKGRRPPFRFGTKISMNGRKENHEYLSPAPPLGKPPLSDGMTFGSNPCHACTVSYMLFSIPSVTNGNANSPYTPTGLRTTRSTTRVVMPKE
jgi:hypothetical protein